MEDVALAGCLPALPNLARLDLDHCWRLTGAALVAHLGGLPHLARLSLAGCFRVGSDALVAAARLPRQRSVDAAACDVNDAAVQARPSSVALDCVVIPRMRQVKAYRKGVFPSQRWWRPR